MKQDIAELVGRYAQNRSEYRDDSYNESETRADFLDRFFEILEWDVANKRNLSRRFREVGREKSLRIEKREKRPDYEFKLGTERKFFVEAKKPAVDIVTSIEAAFQVRRYGWSAGLKISVLSNFEHLAIYDTTVEPVPNQPANHSRLYLFHYTEYPTKIEEIAKLLSRESVYSGLFDKLFLAQTQNRPSEAIDVIFLNQLNRWRLRLCEDILSIRPNIAENTLNELSQLFILRILFLRMCEDRGITNYEQLKETAKANNWDAFINLLIESDQRFDSGLFDRRNDPFFPSSPQSIQLNTGTVQFIIDSLYFPAAPYTFSVFEPEFLGSVYEQFLTQRITTENGLVKLTPKPEHIGRDIVATPRPLIERIVQDTVYASLQGLSSSDILKKKLLDPACGSGGFLISSFDAFIEAMTTAYLQAGEYGAIYESADGWQLTFEQKCHILTQCMYGVDRDYAATEVTKFSLLVKLLENETPSSLPSRKGILPRLDHAIVYGDSLVDNRIYADEPAPTTISVPLTWGLDIPRKFDIVVGNPPYLKTEAMLNLEPTEFAFYRKHYTTAYKQFDKYYLFLERITIHLLADDGVLGMVVSRRFAHIESGKKLRQVLSKDAYITRFIDFGNAQLFEGRTTYTCLLYLSKKKPIDLPQENGVLYSVVTTPEEWIHQQVGTQPPVTLPRYLVSGDNAWLLPATSLELRLIEAMYQNSILLGKVADVFNGIQTSCNDVYVITDWVDRDDKTIAFEKQGRTWFIEKAILKPFFDEGKSTLRSFYPLPDTAQVIYPYNLSYNNQTLQATVMPSAMIQSRFPLAYQWLLHNRTRLEKRDISPRPFPPDEWYRYGRSQALTAFENRPKITVGVNSRGDKYVYDNTNTLLASGSTAGECAIATFRKTSESLSYDLYFILALLNHKAVEYFCRKRGSPFRGGWYARGTSVLQQIPLPKVDLTIGSERRHLYESIVSKCKQLCDVCHLLDRSPSNAERVRLDRRQAYIKQAMDQEISALYGISNIIESVELPG